MLPSVLLKHSTLPLPIGSYSAVRNVLTTVTFNSSLISWLSNEAPWSRNPKLQKYFSQSCFATCLADWSLHRKACASLVKWPVTTSTSTEWEVSNNLISYCVNHYRCFLTVLSVFMFCYFCYVLSFVETAVALLQTIITPATNQMPHLWSETLPPEDQKWILKLVFKTGPKGKQELQAHLKLWSFPPPPTGVQPGSCSSPLFFSPTTSCLSQPGLWAAPVKWSRA